MGGVPVRSILTPEAKIAGFPLSSMSSSSSLVVVRPAASRRHSECNPPQRVQWQLCQAPQPLPHPLSLLISSCLWIRPLQRSL